MRQRGSHIIVEGSNGEFAVVPRKKEIKPGTLLSIISNVALPRKNSLIFSRKKRVKFCKIREAPNDGMESIRKILYLT